ncbi:hypothetical protein TNIN_342851 [Trichonephila inaurata madagascariensis]|uniref:Uncharacterized protein n=1 Tax=Trichonephila inaurata madagascariensis TaxID=2747483 RepID=A0A8X6YKA7_9ARAC|nr:hypothetical protein TNIN_342851 [Trichonephila inaurata madagascariensis]
MTAKSPAILIYPFPDSPHPLTNQDSLQPVATRITRTAAADDCVIHWSANHHHPNSNFSLIQSGGSFFPHTSTSKDSKTFYDMGRRII